MRPLLHLVTVLLILWGAPQIVTAASEDLPLPFHAFDEQAREKVEALLRDHTLKRLLLLKHPILSRPLHQFLLDRPDVGAAISRSLGIGDYSVTRIGKDRFHGRDPDGVEGNMEILYRDDGHRVYYAEGIAEGALITVRGKTVIYQTSQYHSTDQGQEWVKTQITIYAKIENPILAFFVKLFGPLIGKVVDPKISKAQGVVRQVSELMVREPQEAYRRIAESGKLPEEVLATLRELMKLSEHPEGRA